MKINIITLSFLLLLHSTYLIADMDFDVITMRNGDIHQGSISDEFILLESSFGNLKVPKKILKTIQFGKFPEKDTINTIKGELLKGHIKNIDLTIERVLDATLPLDTEDMSHLKASTQSVNQKEHINNAALEMRDGSRLQASILSKDILLKSTNSISILNTKNLKSLDIEASDGNNNLVQIRSNKGQASTGNLLTKRIKIKTNYSTSLDIKTSSITSLLFTPNKHKGMTDFSHRWHTTPPILIQDTIIGGELAPEMILLSHGNYIRGDVNGDTDERLPVSVNIPSFAIGVFEVTFDQYDQYCIETQKECPDDEGWGRGNRPVVNVSWQDATAYTAWLSKKTGKNYRLPSDAEWEYAARSGNDDQFWWGDNVGTANANCEGCGSPWDGEKSAVVGKFPANDFGLHDTAGNVFEWVADCWHDDFSIAPTDGTAIEKPHCGKRVIRSGAWSFQAKEIRSANRWRDFPSRRSDDTGFRIARDL